VPRSLRPGSDAAVNARVLYTDGHRFESPQLHKEVRASRGGFPSAKYLRQFLRLARRLDVCERQSGAVDLSQWTLHVYSPLR
jgi:hypothetical protein